VASRSSEVNFTKNYTLLYLLPDRLCGCRYGKPCYNSPLLKQAVENESLRQPLFIERFVSFFGP